MEEYFRTIKFLYNLQFSGIKLGLENVSALLDSWDNPQQKWPAIHLAGTNGKGSTAAFLFSVLKEAGYRVGLYTSPHLVDFSERIRVNDDLIPWETIVNYIAELKPHIEQRQATFFEATSAVAFRYFADQKVDLAVVETGLGGRLDATNLVCPLVTVITPISIDHQQYLGEDLLQIAREKAGIIKWKIPCVTNNLHPGIVNILKEKCRQQAAPFQAVDTNKTVECVTCSIKGSQFNLRLAGSYLKALQISMAGEFQVRNAALATAVLKKLSNIKITEQNIKNGLKKTFWPGRMQVIREKPLTILDVAHNPHSFQQVFNFITRQFPHKNIWVILGLAKDKDFRKITDILKRYVSRVAIIRNFSDRAMPPEKIVKAFKRSPVTLFQFDDIEEGYHNLHSQINSDDLLLIVGSHYLAGEFLKKYKYLDFNM